jgi:hypothetical protein
MYFIYCDDQIRRMRWVGHVIYMGKMRSAHSSLVGNPEGKIPVERPRSGWRMVLDFILKK